MIFTYNLLLITYNFQNDSVKHTATQARLDGCLINFEGGMQQKKEKKKKEKRKKKKELTRPPTLFFRILSKENL